MPAERPKVGPSVHARPLLRTLMGRAAEGWILSAYVACPGTHACMAAGGRIIGACVCPRAVSLDTRHVGVLRWLLVRLSGACCVPCAVQYVRFSSTVARLRFRFAHLSLWSVIAWLHARWAAPRSGYAPHLRCSVQQLLPAGLASACCMLRSASLVDSTVAWLRCCSARLPPASCLARVSRRSAQSSLGSSLSPAVGPLDVVAQLRRLARLLLC